MSITALRKATLLFSVAATFPIAAKAVIVRGTVKTPFGVPLGNARIQLIQGQKTAAFTYSLPDGSYEIRSSSGGRFVLLTAAAPYTPSIGQDFYAGRTAVVSRDIVMEYTTVIPQLSITATGLSTSVNQLASPVTLIPASILVTQLNLLNDLRQIPGVNVIQTGQSGGPISLYIRGGDATANKILIDTVPSEQMGGRFDLSTLSTTALAGPELYRGPNSALYGTGAEASVLNVATVKGNALHPTLNYTGDAGNLRSYRNEAILSGTHKGLDYLAAFSRFNTSNFLPRDQFHITTSVANLAYNVLTNTQARFTLRNTGSATGLPGPTQIDGISASGKQSDQNLVSGITIENQYTGNLHTVVRYGILRSREQLQHFDPVGQPVASQTGITFYGNPVALRGANGYVATGQAAFITPNFDTVSNRDEFLYQTDYTFPYRIAALFSFHYDNERGRLLDPAATFNQQAQRTNYLYTLQLQGDIKHRLFYSFGGDVEKNHLFGIAGSPRIGLSYAPVRPGHRRFRGTRLRASFATGVQEPSLEAQFTSLESQLNEAGNHSAISAFHVSPLTAERSRTFDFGIDQNILNQKLIVKAGYFHNQFSHQIEQIDSNGLEQYFDVPSDLASQLPAASLNSLAYRTQGLETEVQYQPLVHLYLHGGYTYLASLVEQSLSADVLAVNNGTPTINPNLPGIPIGALSPLVGSRPFRRPANTGFFAVQFASNRFSTALKGALSGRSDDSTFQLNNDLHGTNTLLLPNRNLDFGYAKLDLNVLAVLTSHITAFTQLDNLLSQQHIGPIGYPGLPFTIRAGLKIRVGGD